MSNFFQAGAYHLPLGQRTYIMGILNVTPDSFSDGGKFNDPGAAYERALAMQEQGADMIDIGGQSTRPGYTPVEWEQEWSRLEPVLAKICRALRVPVSVDTFYPQVAQRALEPGVSIINDVKGFADAKMFELTAKYNCGAVIMHDGPGVSSIRPFFEQRLRQAAAYGVRPEQVCFDPGVGFGKTYEENLEVLRCLRSLCVPGCGMLVGASRKRVVGRPCGDPPFEQRLPGTLAAHTLAVAGGADIIRVHDVAESVQAARVADAVLYTTK